MCIASARVDLGHNVIGPCLNVALALGGAGGVGNRLGLGHGIPGHDGLDLALALGSARGHGSPSNDLGDLTLALGRAGGVGESFYDIALALGSA